MFLCLRVILEMNFAIFMVFALFIGCQAQLSTGVGQVVVKKIGEAFRADMEKEEAAGVDHKPAEAVEFWETPIGKIVNIVYKYK